MQPLVIERTEETPLVKLNKENNIFEISGNSYPEDSTAFYGPVIQWLSEYIKNPNAVTEFSFSFDYFNSSSYKAVYDIMQLLAEIPKNENGVVRVKWQYKEGDEDLHEIGEELAATIKVDFSLTAVK